MRLRYACVMLSAVFLSACQTVVPAYIPLSDAAKAKLTSTDVVVPIKQSEIYVFVPDSQIAAAGGGGLLLALVDAGVNAARTSKAEAAVKPLRNALVGYDFDSVVAEQLKTALPQQSVLNVTGVKVTKDFAPANLEKAVTKSQSAAVLMNYIDYQLNNDGNELTVRMSSELFPNTDALKAMRTIKPSKDALSPQNVIYRNTHLFVRTIPAPKPKAERDDYIAAWAANNGAIMRAALNDAAAYVASDVGKDLGVTPAPAAAPAAPTAAPAAPAAAPATPAPPPPAAPAAAPATK